MPAVHDKEGVPSMWRSRDRRETARIQGWGMRLHTLPTLLNGWRSRPNALGSRLNGLRTRLNDLRLLLNALRSEVQPRRRAPLAGEERTFVLVRSVEGLEEVSRPREESSSTH
jgi:hypothetical protein